MILRNTIVIPNWKQVVVKKVIFVWSSAARTAISITINIYTQRDNTTSETMLMPQLSTSLFEIPNSGISLRSRTCGTCFDFLDTARDVSKIRLPSIFDIVIWRRNTLDFYLQFLTVPFGLFHSVSPGLFGIITAAFHFGLNRRW